MMNLKFWCQTGIVAGGVALLLGELNRHARARGMERQAAKEQIQTWEDEGGALPECSQVPSTHPGGSTGVRT